jgi:hypothetical protein
MFGRGGMDGMQQQMQEMQQQMHQAQEQMQQQMQQAQQQANQQIAQANTEASNCPSWTKISSTSSIQASSPGLYCTNSTGGYKCNSSNGSNISVVGCPANLKTSRRLYLSMKNKFGDALDEPEGITYYGDALDWSDENDFWNVNGDVEKAIKDCKSWSQVSNNISGGQGIYCYIRDFNSNIPGNIQTFKCDFNQDSTFIRGNCPVELMSGRASDADATPADVTTTAAPVTDAPATTNEWTDQNGDDKMHFWY